MDKQEALPFSSKDVTTKVGSKLCEPEPCVVYKNKEVFKIFDSRTDCARYFGVFPHNITYWIKVKKRVEIEGQFYAFRNYNKDKQI